MSSSPCPSQGVAPLPILCILAARRHSQGYSPASTRATLAAPVPPAPAPAPPPPAALCPKSSTTAPNPAYTGLPPSVNGWQLREGSLSTAFSLTPSSTAPTGS